MDPATLAAAAAKARKAIKAIKVARQAIRENGGLPWWLYALVGFALMLPMMIMLFILLLPMAALAVVINEVTDIPGFKLAGGALTGIGCALGSDQACAVKELIDAAKAAGIDDAIKSEVDCQNLDPDFPQEWCDAGALATPEDEVLPIPAESQWMIPIYVKAGVDNGIPWELLAAVHGARTNFGQDNCMKLKDGGILKGERVVGGGQYNFTKNEWIDFGFDAGYVEPYIKGLDKDDNAPPEDQWGSIKFKDGCGTYTPALKRKILKESDRKENMEDDIDESGSGKQASQRVTDPVDAIYTQARILKHYGLGEGKDAEFYWSKYSGGPAMNCAGTGSDMPFQTLYPYASGGNARVPIPQDIIALAERYTYVRWTKSTFPATFGQVPGETKGFREDQVIPRDVEKQIIYAAGRGLGMPDDVIAQVMPNLMAMIQGESGFQTSRLQGEIGDVNDAYPKKARGLFQFVPGTFGSAHVPGYDNIYNPLHNTLAAMNAMRNATSMAATAGYDNLGQWGLWPKGSGWSPGYKNPYAGDTASSEPSGPYKGAKIDLENDPFAHAVASRPGEGEYYDPCYVAHVHDWYKALTEITLGADLNQIGGPVLERMRQAAEAQDGVPYSLGQGTRTKAAYSKLGLRKNTKANGGSGLWDCSSFTAYVFWVGAGIWMEPHTDAQWTLAGGGLTETASENEIAIRGVLPTKPPGGFQIGDLFLYRSGAGGWTGHVIMAMDAKTARGSGDPNKAYPIDGYPMTAMGWVRIKKLAEVATQGSGEDATATDLPGVEVKKRPISYSAERKKGMAKYSKKRYGTGTSILAPKAIVMHYTVNNSVDSTFNVFDPETTSAYPDVNVCAHYVVDKDGSIYEFVPPTTRCRHAIGMNHAAIGIEVVEPTSVGNIVKRPAQYNAIIKLVKALQAKYDISKSDVVGHGEANNSRYFKDLTGQRNDHTDWKKSEMNALRAKL